MHYSGWWRDHMCNLNIPVRMQWVAWNEEYWILQESVSFIVCQIVDTVFFNSILCIKCTFCLWAQKWKSCVNWNMSSLVPVLVGWRWRENFTKTNVVSFIFGLLQHQGIITVCTQHWSNKIRLFIQKKKKKKPTTTSNPKKLVRNVCEHLL